MPDLYDHRFFATHRAGSRSSADAILRPLLDALHPSSVVDVGCGIGTWLAAVRAAGVEDVVGVDGPWVGPAALEIPAELFTVADLDRPLALARSFDLALCMETAEHLPPARAAGLVADLVRLAPVVLFSAAIPGQGGARHLNEQWPEFWAELFASHRYRLVDAVRLRHWDDDRVEPWYAQNAFVYVGEGQAVALEARPGLPMRAVHPGVFATKLDPRLASREFAARSTVWHLGLGLLSVVRRCARVARGLLRAGR
jgi:SAM-dependent methyltransferase